MAKVTNTRIYDLDEAIYISGYPMLEEYPNEEKFKTEVSQIHFARMVDNDYRNNPHIKRAINLARAKGGGHDQFLTGIIVAMDLTLSNKVWVEAERYKFLNFISSMSTMHRASKFKIYECCNRFVSEESIEKAESLRQKYNLIDGEREPEKKKEVYLELLYNLPSGFELTAGMITNYRCLKNIYQQRRNHRLPDWHVVCDWIESLPMAFDLITGGSQ